jgi:fatty acyl-CoA reductase
MLQAFIHISTAYCHLNEPVLYEKLYPPPADPHKIIKCAEWLEDGVINAMTKK